MTAVMEGPDYRYRVEPTELDDTTIVSISNVNLGLATVVSLAGTAGHDGVVVPRTWEGEVSNVAVIQTATEQLLMPVAVPALAGNYVPSVGGFLEAIPTFPFAAITEGRIRARLAHNDVLMQELYSTPMYIPPEARVDPPLVAAPVAACPCAHPCGICGAALGAGCPCYNHVPPCNVQAAYWTEAWEYAIVFCGPSDKPRDFRHLATRYASLVFLFPSDHDRLPTTTMYLHPLSQAVISKPVYVLTTKVGPRTVKYQGAKHNRHTHQGSGEVVVGPQALHALRKRNVQLTQISSDHVEVYASDLLCGTTLPSHHVGLCPSAVTVWTNHGLRIVDAKTPDQAPGMNAAQKAAWAVHWHGPITAANVRDRCKVEFQDEWLGWFTMPNNNCWHSIGECQHARCHNGLPTVFTVAQINAAHNVAQTMGGVTPEMASRLATNGTPELADLSRGQATALMSIVSEYDASNEYVGMAITTELWLRRLHSITMNVPLSHWLTPSHMAHGWFAACTWRWQESYSSYLRQYLTRAVPDPMTTQCWFFVFFVMAVFKMAYRSASGWCAYIPRSRDPRQTTHVVGLLFFAMLAWYFRAYSHEYFPAPPTPPGWMPPMVHYTRMGDVKHLAIEVGKLLLRMANFMANVVVQVVAVLALGHYSVWYATGTTLAVTVCEELVKYSGPAPVWVNAIAYGLFEAGHYLGAPHLRTRGTRLHARAQLLQLAKFSLYFVGLHMLFTAPFYYATTLTAPYKLMCSILLHIGVNTLIMRLPRQWNLPTATATILNYWDHYAEQTGQETSRKLISQLNVKFDMKWAARMFDRIVSTPTAALVPQIEVDADDHRTFFSKDPQAAQEGYLAKGEADGWRANCWMKMTGNTLASTYVANRPSQDRYGYLNTGAPADMISPVWNGSLANIKAALGKRHARAIKYRPCAEFRQFAADVTATLAPQLRDAVAVVRGEKDEAGRFNKHNVHVLTFEEWVRRFPQEKLDTYVRQNNKFVNDRCKLREATCFVKFEASGGKEDAAKPRGIQGTSWPLYGRYLMATAQCAVEAVLDGKTEYKTQDLAWKAKYSCGMTAEQLGSWVADRDRQSFDYVESDIKAFDGSFHELPNANETELVKIMLPEYFPEYYAEKRGKKVFMRPTGRQFAMHKEFEEASKATHGRVVMNYRGKQFVAAKFRIDGQRRSGDPQTSWGNSIWNTIIHLWASRTTLRRLGKNLYVEVIVLGDDSMVRFIGGGKQKEITAIYEKAITTAGHEPAVVTTHIRFNMGSFCSRYLFFRPAQDQQELDYAKKNAWPGVPVMLSAPMRVLQRGMVLRLRLPMGWRGTKAGLAYAAAVLQAKVALWQSGGSEVPIVREALARGIPPAFITPKTSCYEENLRMISMRLMLPCREVAAVAHTMATHREYCTTDNSVNIIRRLHPNYYQVAVQMEMGEQPHSWAQAHPQVRPRNMPGPLFNRGAALARLNPGIRVAMAVIAATYGDNPADRLYAETIVANVNQQLEFQQTGDSRTPFVASSRQAIDLLDYQNPGDPDVTVTPLTSKRLNWRYSRWTREMLRRFNRAAMPNWLRPEAETVASMQLARTLAAVRGEAIYGLY